MPTMETPITKVLRASTTSLAGTLANQPWNSYRFGQGINAMTGQLADVAVKPFNIKSFPSMTSTLRYITISSDEDYEQAFNAEAGGSYNMGGVKVSGSASFLNNVTYSKTSLTIVASYEIASEGYGTPDSAPTLTDDAQNLADTDPKTFRQLYGDYFVSNAISGARFLATYTCSASNSTSLTSFKASIQGSNDLVTAEGAVAFEKKASATNVAVSCMIYMEGINKIQPHFGTSADAIPKALAWFGETDATGVPVNVSYVPRRAMLTHYSQLVPILPNVLDVDPVVFAHIQTTGFLITQVNDLMATLPEYYQTIQTSDGETYGAKAASLNQTFTASQASLPLDTTGLVDKLTTTALDMLAYLRSQVALYSFYTSLTDAPPAEGKNGSSTQSFGYNSTPAGLSIKVLSNTQNYSQQSGIGSITHSFVWPGSGIGTNVVIVGWEIVDNWGDGTNGNWDRPGNAMIGASTGDIGINGEYDRGINWSLVVYYVDKGDFPWL